MDQQKNKTMTCPKLAIIIPAYKVDFLEQSVRSIASQSCKDFTLYIGDDASPSDLKVVLQPFEDEINIVYKRFEENIGGKNLVAQWDRCLNMIIDEEWIWLFSDDDIMEDNCVALFYEHINANPDHNLVHFNIQTIDENGKDLYKMRKFPPAYSATEFFDDVLNRKVFSTVVEYIFKREIFEKVNRFQQFDLAWSSDNATWMKLALYGGIHTIEGATVKWRVSGLNISSISNDKTIVYRKVNASIDFFNWSKHFFSVNNLVDTTSDLDKLKSIMITVVYTSAIDNRDKYQLIMRSLKALNLEQYNLISMLLWLYEETKKKTKSMISYKGY